MDDIPTELLLPYCMMVYIYFFVVLYFSTLICKCDIRKYKNYFYSSITLSSFYKIDIVPMPDCFLEKKL